jgi:thioredoxin reductase (NADPH)
VLVQTNEVSEIALRGIFYAIGHKPNTELFRNFISLDAAGYIKTEPGTPLTNIEGVFAAGDVQVHTLLLLYALYSVSACQQHAT